tara:strand:- start:3257 stop:3490 length:234 start_codon:yes stop_codon:yes gene_type:complete
MNAYKLAEELQGFGYFENDLHFCHFQAQVDMLRHQADYIAQLEKGLESVTEFSKALEAKHKEEFDYAEKLLKERDES